MNAESEQSVGTTVELPIPVRAKGLFRYKPTAGVLRVLTENPYTEFSIRELARATGEGADGVSKAVSELKDAGLLTTRRVGRRKLVGIDRERLHKPDDPVVSIPQSEFHEPVRALREGLLERLGDVLGMVVFGSVARGEADRRSDIDVFVVVEGERSWAQARAHEVARELEDERFGPTGRGGESESRRHASRRSQAHDRGQRYEFGVLVESVESVERLGPDLHQILREGIAIERSETFDDLRREVLADGRE